MELTDAQIERQDDVDNAIFYMLKNNVPFDREKFLATA